MRASSADKPTRRALTLVEVLACVAVAIGLLPVAFVTSGEARKQSKSALCLSNLGRLGAASAIYAAAEPSEFGVPARPLMGRSADAGREYEWGGKSGRGEPLTGSGALYSRWGTSQGLGPATRPLNQILFGNVFADYVDDAGPAFSNWESDTRLDMGVFHCPSDFGYTGHHFAAWRDSKLSSFDHYGNSYSAVTSWIGVPGANCRLDGNTSFMRPVSRVPNPRQTLLFIENCARFAHLVNYGTKADGGCRATRGFGAGGAGTILGWHGQAWRFQGTFVDGHASAVTIRGHRQPAPRLGHYPNWGGVATDHDFWHCVIFRGPGWQVDTLPAPPIPTELPCLPSSSIVNPVE